MWTLTASTLMDFLTCPKMYQIKQILGYHPKGISWKLDAGNAYHEALEIQHTKGKEAAMQSVQLFYQDIFQRDCTKEDFSQEKLEQYEAMVSAMVEFTPWPVEWLDAAEMEFDVGLDQLGFYPDGALKNQFRLAGKLDGIGLCHTGRKVVRDYKTKGEIAKASAPHMLSRNLQASFYYYVCQKALGYEDLEGVHFCMVRRPSIKRTKKETNKAFCKRMRLDYADRPDFYYAENLTLRDPADDSFLVNLWHMILQIDENTNSGRWYENYTQCKGFGKGCVYLPFCTGETGWVDHYERHEPNHHPELKGI